MIREQQNHQISNKESTDVTSMILGNIPQKYMPDPRTYKIISRLMDSLPVNNDEEAILESFYSYFDATIKTVAVSNLEPEWINNILENIPTRMKSLNPELVTGLLKEVSEAFIASSRESAVDYILVKPVKKNSEKYVINFFNRLSILRKYEKKQIYTGVASWHDDFVMNKAIIEETLYCCHPIMRELLYLWGQYSELRIIDNNIFKNQKDPYRISSFRNSVLVQSEKCQSALWNGYVYYMYSFYI